MNRALAVSASAIVALLGCGDARTVRDAGPPDAGPLDAASDGRDCDGGCAALGEVCGESPIDLDAGARPCQPGLVCCYPCGIPDCADRCTAPCGPPGPGCQDDGCPGPLP